MARVDDELPEIEVMERDVDAHTEVDGEVVSGPSPSRIQWVVGTGVAAVGLIAAALAFRDDPTSPNEQAEPDDTTTSTDPADSGQAEGTSPSASLLGEWRSLPSTVTRPDPSPFMAALDEDRVLIVHTVNGGEAVDGEILNLRTGTAESIADSPLRWRAFPMIGWTGHELIVVGGSNGPGIEVAGAAYHPGTDTWRRIAEPPGFVPGRSENQAVGPGVWTGAELISWKSGLAYHLTDDSWFEIGPTPLAPRSDEAVISTRTGVIVWGGCSPGCGDERNRTFSDGALYDPNSYSWTVLPDGPLGSGTGPFAADTGTGRALVVLAHPDDPDAPTVAALDLSTLEWDAVDEPPKPGHPIAVVWTGTHVVVLGGDTEDDPPGSSLLMFSPGLNRWRSIPTGGTTRYGFASLWTPHGLFIAGGGPTAQPALYTPAGGTPCPNQYDPRDRPDPSTDTLPELGATSYEHVAETILVSAQDIADRYSGTVDVTVGPGWGMAYEDHGRDVEIHRDLDDYSITVHFADETRCTYPAPGFYPGPGGRPIPVRFVYETV